MSTVFDYNRWLADLEGYLRTRRPDVKVADLDPNAMHQAFMANESPFVFGSKPQLPLRHRTYQPDDSPQNQPVVASVKLMQGVPSQTGHVVVPSFLCQKCGLIMSVQTQYCPRCGTNLTQTKASDAGVWGLLGIIAAGVGFLMCQLFVPFFILASLIFAVFAYHKGAKAQAVVSFIMCALLLTFFVHTLVKIQADVDQMNQSLPR